MVKVQFFSSKGESMPFLLDINQPGPAGVELAKQYFQMLEPSYDRMIVNEMIQGIWRSVDGVIDRRRL